MTSDVAAGSADMLWEAGEKELKLTDVNTGSSLPCSGFFLFVCFNEILLLICYVVLVSSSLRPHGL